MKYLIKNANIIPMNEETVLSNMDVLIVDGKIAEIAENISAEDVKIINCDDKYLMPGLFDMHVHLNNSDIVDLLFANGVTSIKNMWGFPKTLEWQKAINEGRKIGPTVYSTGPLTDGVDYWKGSNIVKTPEEGEASVLKDIKDGYDFIKTYPSIPKEAFLKMMAVANENNIKVVGHGNEFLTTKELIDSKYYCIEHTNCLPKEREEIIDIAKSGMWLCPTQAVVWTIYDFVINDKELAAIPYYEYVNAKEKEMWEEITKWRKEKPKDEKRRFSMEEVIQRGKTFIEHSDNILLGTDTDNPGVVAGFSIHDELSFMINDFGMTPYQAIKTGTVNAARHLGVLEKVGTIEVGKVADLLILDKNPLEDIRNTKTINGIVKNNFYYNREAIDEMLIRVLDRPIEEVEVVYKA